jgi:class 3 adenylate cyclase/tetratricopeptide (TPR) repeat protein
MAPEDRRSFAELLGQYRRLAGLTQEALAERAHLSVRGISDLERGVNRTPRRATVALLAAALGLSAAERAVLEAALQRPRTALRPAWPPAAPVAPVPAMPLSTDAGLTAPLAALGETRVLTVLCVTLSAAPAPDVATDLSPDERAERLRELLQLVDETIAVHGGQLTHALGEDLVAVFGTPLAHENDPERAILAALALGTLLEGRGLALHAGIESGTVHLGALRPGPGAAAAAIGHAADLASGLRRAAQAGQLLVGPVARRQTRGAFTFAPHAVTLPGRAQPVLADRVTRVVPYPQKTRGIEGLRAPLIGREEELARLHAALAAVHAGQGQIVILSGGAGVGKSRLIAELRAAALASSPGAARGHLPGEALPSTLLWLEGRCLDLGKTVSYWPFLDMLRAYFSLSPDDDERARGARLVVALQDLVRRGLLPPERGAALLPLLANLLAARFGDERDAYLRHAGPEQIRHQTFQALRDLFVALARRQPLVVVVEDLHWADGLSVDLLALLLETVPVVPLLLLCVARPIREHRSRHLGTLATRLCPERFTALQLHDLSPTQSRRLVESLLQEEALPSTVKEHILARGQGNPFFLEEIVRSLIEAGLLYHDGAVWCARAEISAVAVPESVQSVIVSRVDRLAREAKHILQSAAVLGRLFRRRLLAEVIQRGEDLDDVLGELEDRQLIYLERVLPEEEYSFQHVLTQETVYQSIPRLRRAQLHHQVAEALERLYGESLEEYYEQLAHHYDQAGVVEKTVEYLLKAGEKARRTYHTAEALTYFQGALHRLGGTPLGNAHNGWRLAALKGLGQSHHGSGKPADGEVYLRQAIALGQEMGLAPRELVRLYYWLEEVVFWQGRHADRIRLGEQGLALLGDDTASAEAALMNATIGWGCFLHGDTARARECAQRNAAFLPGLPYSEELAPAYLLLVRTSWMFEQDTDEALRWATSLATAAQEHHDMRGMASAEGQGRAEILWAMGDTRGAMMHLQHSVDLFRTIGDTKQESEYRGLLAEHCFALGDLHRAEEHARRALALADVTGSPRGMAACIGHLGDIALCHGEVETVPAYHEKAARLWREMGEPVACAWATLWLGRAAAARHEHAAALAYLEEAVMLGCGTLEAMGRAFFAQAFSAIEDVCGDPQRVRELVERLGQEHPHAQAMRLVPCLEPAELTCPGRERLHDAFVFLLSAGWSWHDPFGDCSWTVQDGLRIRAANQRAVWQPNVSAPRLLRAAPPGEFAVQTICGPLSDAYPALGGLLLWDGRDRYLTLDQGSLGRGEIMMRVCLDGKDGTIGRGRLPSARVWLRLERQGGRVRALCSADGRAWFTAGAVEFPYTEGEQIGLYANGMIDRTIYRGAYPEGTAIRFESCTVWTAEAT